MVFSRKLNEEEMKNMNEKHDTQKDYEKLSFMDKKTHS